MDRNPENLVNHVILSEMEFEMKKWNLEKRIQNTECRSQNVLLVIIILVLLAFAGHSNAAEPNEPNIDILSGYDSLLAMGMPDDSNDGFTLGFFGQESSEAGEGRSVVQIGYDYGCMNAFFGIDISYTKYIDIGAKFYTRDLAEVDSVLFLSDIVLLLADTEAVVLASSGVAHSWEGNIDYTSTLAGLKIKGSEDSPIVFEPEVRFPLDRNPIFFFGLKWEF